MGIETTLDDNLVIERKMHRSHSGARQVAGGPLGNVAASSSLQPPAMIGSLTSRSKP
jgi:hypothetical protein